MTRFSELLSGQTLLPIIQADTPEQGLHIARAMADANLRLVEVVLRTPSSLETISVIKRELPSLCVGAGTVTSPKILDQALDTKADFIVTPAVSVKLLHALRDCNLPVLPGVSNTADILLACEHGFLEQKLFPASLSGGAPFLSAISSVFPSISFCPTGGVNPENQMEYLSLANVFAVGGTWVAKKEWVADKHWSSITQACCEALQIA